MPELRFLLVFSMIFSLLSLAACDDIEDETDGDGDSDADGDSDGDGDGDPQCSWSSTGTGGTLGISIDGERHELETHSTNAMNTLDIEGAGQLAFHRYASARQGDCDAGVVFVREGADGEELAFLSGATGTAESVASFDRGDAASLFYDDSCQPVIIEAGSGSFVEHQNDGTAWTSTTVLDPDVDLVDEGVDWISHVASELGRDGLWHVFALGQGGDETKLVHGSRSPAAEGSWTFEVLDLPESTDIDDLAVDSAGALHLVYRNTQYPCDPCDLSLYYARRPADGDWSTAVVQPGRWGDPNDELAREATIAVNPEDQPFIAAQFQTRVVTGSLTSTVLRVYGLVGDEFCGEDVAVESDGYAGSDGIEFTGSNPALEIDDTGRLHVLFADLSAWHTSDGANAIPGQLRYAIRAGSTWQVETLIEQPGQTDSNNPLQGMSAPSLALASDGSSAFIAASQWSWSTDSIYNMSELPLELNGFAQAVSLTQ